MYPKNISPIENVVACLMTIALLVLANLHRMPSSVTEFLLLRITYSHLLLGMVFLIFWSHCFYGVEKSRRDRSPTFLVLANVIWGATLATLLLASILYIARVTTPVWPVIPIFWLANVVLVAGRITLLQWLLSSTWHLRTRVLIVGTGPTARRAWREIRTSYSRSTSIVGFVDTGGPLRSCSEIAEAYLGDVRDLEDILFRNVVDTIVIALPPKLCSEVADTVHAIGEKVGVDVVLQSFYNRAREGFELQRHLEAAMHESSTQILKRSIDLVVASLAIILFLPLMLLIAIGVKITSCGPAIFAQERYGFRRRRFTMFKFRTMIPGTEQPTRELEEMNEAKGPIFKIKDDPRVTRFGKFLRRTSLDELPQLFNVLNGNMSLVGPRPMSVRDVALFSESYLMRRFRVKPGMTGLWQVSGRSSLSFDQWIAMDFTYIDNWSISLDLEILLRTIPAVLKGSGAV